MDPPSPGAPQDAIGIRRPAIGHSPARVTRITIGRPGAPRHTAIAGQVGTLSGQVVPSLNLHQEMTA
jgi:hypothetical protein